MLWLVDLSAGLIDDLLLLPQDYRSSSPGGEGNSSEHGREKQREARGQKERERGMEGERERGLSKKMEGKIGEGRWEENRRGKREGD